jgi:PAS domain S-box-containing protein
LVARDGRRTPITERATPIEADDELLGAVLVFHNVSESRQVQETLRQRAAEIEDLYNNAPCGYLSLDANGTFVRLNDTLLRWLGYRREELVGVKKLSDVMTPHSRAAFENYYPAFRERGNLHDVEYELTRRDGSVLPTMLNASATLDSMGDPGGYVMSRVTLTDLAERKRAEEERRQLETHLQNAQRLDSLGLLAAGVAHDLNNLLTGVLGYAELATIETTPGSLISSYLEHIVTAGRQLGELTRQLLSYAGKGAVTLQPMDLSRFVQATTEVLRPPLRDRCTLECEFPERLPLIQGDPAKIRQIVTNLVINAAEACDKLGGTVRVRTGMRDCDLNYLGECHLDGEVSPGPYVFLEVSDTGCGMDASTRARIFDPFFTTKFSGRGLGLATLLGIVRSHHGTIKVTSEVGVGSSFVVLFPAYEPPQKPTGIPTPAQLWQPSGLILIADDDRVARDLTSAHLTRMGFSVVETADATAAVEFYRANHSRLKAVLLDLTMPGKDGVETFREMNRICPNVPVLLCSGFGSDYCRQFFDDQTPAAFLDKPHHYEELRATLYEVLKDPRHHPQPKASATPEA